MGEQMSQRDRLYERLVHEIGDAHFTTPKQLRHAAEAAGFTFIPTEVLLWGDTTTEVRLNPPGIGPVQVRAERKQPWHPFHVVSVEKEW